MRILIINDNGIEVGGAETYLINLKKALLNRGHDTRILTSKPPVGTNSFSDYTFTGVNQTSAFRIFPYMFNFSSYQVLRKIIKEFKPDIVHLHFIFYHTSPSILFLLKNIPVVLTTHAHELISPVGVAFSNKCNHPFVEYCVKCTGLLKYYPEKLKRIIFKLVSRNINFFIAPSNYYETLYKQYGFKKIKTIHNGIQIYPSFTRTPTKNKRMLFVGRLAKEKGVEYILRAMPLILKIFPNATLTVVGDGPGKFYLNSLTDELQIRDRVVFTGKLANRKLDTYYKEASVVIVPSFYPDNLPTVCIEAMNCGRPLVASRIGGITELVKDGKNGYLFEPGNFKNLAEKVTELFSDKAGMIQMGLNSREMVKEFDINTHTEKLLKVYKSLITK